MKISEAKTRARLIDPQLLEAGWRLDDRTQVRLEIPATARAGPRSPSPSPRGRRPAGRTLHDGTAGPDRRRLPHHGTFTNHHMAPAAVQPTSPVEFRS